MKTVSRKKPKNRRLSRGLKKKLILHGTDEVETKRLEQHIPELAKIATTKAYRRVLASGSRVLIAEEGQLKQVSPNGEVQIIRQIEPPVKMRKGQIIEIK